jgi:hypothetical protein
MRRADVPSARLDIASSIAPGCAKEPGSSTRPVHPRSPMRSRAERDALRHTNSPVYISTSLPFYEAVMNPRVGETHGETRGWGAVVSPRGGQRRWTDFVRARTKSCLGGDRSHSGSMVWRWLEARRSIEMGRPFVPPPQPTNRPQMREWGRERPPSPTRETGFRATAEGRSRPDFEPRLCRTTWPSTQSGSWPDRAAPEDLPPRRFSALAVGSSSGNNGFGRNGPCH